MTDDLSVPSDRYRWLERVRKGQRLRELQAETRRVLAERRTVAKTRLHQHKLRRNERR